MTGKSGTIAAISDTTASARLLAGEPGGQPCVTLSTSADGASVAVDDGEVIARPGADTTADHHDRTQLRTRRG